MKEGHDFRLSPTLLQSSFKKRHLAVHRARNSLLRNIITEGTPQKPQKQNDNYEKYLKLNPIYMDQMTVFLRCICDSPERTLSNRNVLKRIMVQFFQDDIISNIKGDSFFDKIQLIELRKGTLREIDTHTRHFYMVLKGKVIFRNSLGSTKAKAKECYGHEELLSRERIESMEAMVDSVLLCVDQTTFNEGLGESYNVKIRAIQKKLSRHPCFKECGSFEMIRLMLEMTKSDLKEGDPLSIEGDTIRDVHFLAKGRLSSPSQYTMICKGVGLKQISNCLSIFEQTVTAGSDCEMFSAPLSIFRKPFYVNWLRDSLPPEPVVFHINIEEISNSDKKSNFKVRKANMSMKKTSKMRSKSRGKHFHFENSFLFLNERPHQSKRFSLCNKIGCASN